MLHFKHRSFGQRRWQVRVDLCFPGKSDGI